jgi:hypothetical protein
MFKGADQLDPGVHLARGDVSEGPIVISDFFCELPDGDLSGLAKLINRHGKWFTRNEKLCQEKNYIPWTFIVSLKGGLP